MTAVAYTLQGLVLAAYLGVVIVYFRYFQTGAPELRWLCRPTLYATLAIHGVFLILLGRIQGAAPLITPGQTMTVLAGSMALVYLLIETRTGHREMGVFVLSFALIFQLLSVFLSGMSPAVPETLQGVRLPAHALAGLVGYAILGLGAVFSLLLLLLRRRIKRRRLGILFQRLPSIRVLDTMSLHATSAGFVLLTVSLVSGSLWSLAEWGTLFPRDPKLIGVLVVWILYAVYEISRLIPGWSRRNRALWGIGSFAVLTVNFTVVGFLADSRHSW